MAPVEDGRRDLPAEGLRRVAEVNLEHLADVHTARDAEGVEDDVQRRAVGHIGHILARENAGDDALVAVAAGHFVAHGDLALLRDVHAHDLVHSGAHLVAGFAGEHLYVHDYAALAVRDLERGVAHFAGLFAEYGAQQPLLGGQVGLALGRDLADEYVAAPDLAPTEIMRARQGT